MEPLDTDYVENEPRAASSTSRMAVLFILPIIGLALVLTFIAAAIFQFDLSNVVDSLVGLMMFLFFVLIALLFWALAPRSHHT